MANKIVQRLIAAGASPQRAQAFATQFTESAPGVKTADLEDAFDDQLAELSKVYFPNVFRPPALDDPRINDYVSFVYGPTKFADLEAKVYSSKAPQFSKAKLATNYAKTIAGYIEAGASPAEMDSLIAADALSGLLTKNTFTVIDPLKTAKQTASDFASKLFTEYSAATSSIDKAKADFLALDKTYAAGLPSPKLKYGREENLAQGLISWKTHPEVEKYLNNPEYKALIPKVQSIASGTLGGYSYGNDPRMTADMNEKAALQNTAAYNKVVAETKGFKNEDVLFKEFSTSKANPLKDEISRREYLKKKTGR